MTRPTLYQNEKAYAPSWVVYMNGLEIPCSGVTVSHGVWQIPEAQLQFAPDRLITRVGAEDRVQVQIFFSDLWHKDIPEYVLGFDGEVVGWGYTQAGSHRSVSYSCVDYMQVLTQLFFFFMGSFDDIAIGTSGQEIGVQGSTIQMAGYGALYPYSLFSQGLADPGDSEDNNTVINRPIDFAYNVVRSMLKAQHPNRTIAAANWFAPWARRTNFHRRWTALPYLDGDPQGARNVGVFPILRAVQAEQAMAAVMQQARQAGTSGSIWDMLGDILRTMMMEINCNPAPPLVRSDFNTLMPMGSPEGAGSRAFLANYNVKPQFFFGLPPSCNVIFPPMISEFTYQENYATQPTRMYFNEEAILSALSQNGQPSAGLSTMLQDALTCAYPEDVHYAMSAARAAPELNGKNLLVFPEEYFKGPVIDRRVLPRWFVYLQRAETTPPPSGGEGGVAPASTATPPATPAAAVPAPTQPPSTTTTASPALTRTPRTAPAATGTAAPSSYQPLFYPVQLERGRVYDYGRAPGGRDCRFESDEAFGGRRNGREGNRHVWWSTGTFDQTRQSGSRHDALDVIGPLGARVVATRSGRVLGRGEWRASSGTGGVERRDGAGWSASGAGWYVRIEADDGSTDYYAHLLERPLVAPGQRVEAGQQLGLLGQTGNAAGSCPHLHYGVRDRNGQVVNPIPALQPLFDAGGWMVDNTAFTGTPPPAPAPVAPPVDAPPTSAGDIAAPSAATGQVASGDSTRNVFRKYAEYEYYKERYSRRQGGVTMPFTPYPVAGYPCAIFTSRQEAVDVFGYVMNVRHSLHTSQAPHTTVSFTHGRTVQEMFALMQRTYASEAARLGLSREQVTTAVTSNQRGNIAGVADPVGAIAVAPAEPLTEVGSVVQHFSRANEFYGAILYRGIAPTATEFMRLQQQAPEGIWVAETEVAYADDDTVSALASRESGLGTADIVTGAQNIAADRVAEAALTGTASANVIAPRAVFWYSDILDFIPPDGDRTSIAIEGNDATTRAQLLAIIARIRAGTATAEDARNYIEATGYPTIPESTTPPTPLDPEAYSVLSQHLDDTEIEQRTRAPRTNVQGDVDIVPRQGAEQLFLSHVAAMRYTSRPICTLEEYVTFLGAQGLREGRVEPDTAASNRGKQLMVAPFYARIRRFRPGPPVGRPSANVTENGVIADATTDPSTPTLPAGATRARGQDWRQLLDSLPDYLRMPALAMIETLAANGVPGAITATDVDTLEQQLIVASENVNIDPSYLAGVQTALARYRNEPLGTAPVPVTTGAAPASTASTGETPTNAVSQLAYIDGIPADFPDTRADWDSQLERYRTKILTRLAPMS